MSSTAWIAAAAVISMLSGIAALVTAFADLSARPLATWSRRARLATAALLLSPGLVLIAATSLRRAARPSVPAASTVNVVAEAPDSTIETPPRRSAESHQLARQHGARVTICLDSGCLDQLEAAVDRALGTRPYRVVGAGDLSMKHEADLGGVITADLAIRVRVLHIADGRVLQSFSLLARGGGFDENAARRQATERMESMLIEKLGTK